MDVQPDLAVSKSSRPNRQPSRRQALPRRSTKGPLGLGDAIDDPLAGEPELQQDHESDIAPSSTSSSQLLPPPDVKPASQLLPTSDLKPVPTPEPSPSIVPEPSVTVVERPAKNFGYLLKPDNFLPLNIQDVPIPFRDDVSKHSPSRDLSTLLSSGHFRAAAVMAADQLKNEPDPTNYIRIFELLYVRFVCLQLLGLEFQAAQEAKCLQDLNAPFYRDRTTTKHIVPWELRVLAIRLHAIGFGDWRRGIMAYYDLARDARFQLRSAVSEEKQLWKDRLQDLGIRVGNALVEIGDMDGAVRHLENLPIYETTSGLMRTRLGFALLKCGNVQAAKSYLQGADGEKGLDDLQQRIMNALIKMADGSFDEAINLWEKANVLEASSEDSAVITQNLALCQLYMGDIQKARDLLESLVDGSGHFTGITFNLSTIYELCSEKSRDLKLQLADRVAAQNGASTGWDMTNADFKL